MKNFYLTFLFCLITGFLFEADAEIIYVNSTATGMDNGTSWENAYTDLQDALMNADQGDSILVAAGTYLPGTASNATFLIDKNLTLLGGFPAAGGTLEERDPAAHETILSGDPNGDDVNDDLDRYK